MFPFVSRGCKDRRCLQARYCAMYKANLAFMWSVWCQCVVDMTGYSHTASVCFELQCSSPFREYTSLFCIYLKFWIFLQSTLGPWNYLNFKPAFEVFKVLKNGGPWKSWMVLENFHWIMEGYSLELFAELLWVPVTCYPLIIYLTWLDVD